MIITVYKNINNVKDRKRKHKTTNITKSKASSACHHKRKQGKKKEECFALSLGRATRHLILFGRGIPADLKFPLTC